MSNPTTLHHTFVIERRFPHSPERVFAAFADPALKRRWFAEGHSHDLELFEMDFRVGGAERTRSRFKEGSPFPGVALISEGVFHDIIPHQRIIISATMSMEDRRFSVALATFEFLPAETGTELILTHQAAFLEGADGPEMREQGWRKLLDSLAAELGVPVAG